jgi:hypothetical protein
MATKLGVFNGALTAIGARRIADTGEAIEPARELAAVYTQTVSECLAAGSWNFATETIQADADTGVTPSFGYTEVFSKPADWVRTVAVSGDEYFTQPLLRYYDDAGVWSADISPVYVRYVSSDTGMGFALDRWTPFFTRYVELELADRVCLKLTQNASLEESVGRKRDKARKQALNQDAMDEPQPKFLPPGSWTLSRGGRVSRRDRGSRGSLID